MAFFTDSIDWIRERTGKEGTKYATGVDVEFLSALGQGWKLVTLVLVRALTTPLPGFEILAQVIC